MKFGFVLVSFVRNAERAEIAKRSLSSLARTDMNGIDTPVMYLGYRAMGFEYLPYVEALKMHVVLVPDAPGRSGNVNLFVTDTTNKLLVAHPELTHLSFMWDDFIYNPRWLQELSGVIERHPKAVAWTVYRQAYPRHHRVLDGDGNDVRVTSIDGVGAMTKEEWEAYGADKISDFTVPGELGGGCTIDVHHAYARPGERWATGRDYIQNIGIHPWLGRMDMALDFVGE